MAKAVTVEAVTVALNLFTILFFVAIYTQPASAIRRASLWSEYVGPRTHFLHWTVESTNVTRNCEAVVIPTVNGMFPGPTIDITEGDTLVITVLSKVDTDVTIHWHGIRQMLTNWADGPSHITQCPMTYGESYTYEFTVSDQSGTYFWHAHVHWLRATVYGAFIVHPLSSPPYATPAAEFPILFGEWFPNDPNAIEAAGLASHGFAFNGSTAFTVGGWPGPLYNCSTDSQTLNITVTSGNTYLLQLVNAALNNNHFFVVANHSMTVVAADGNYVEPFDTTVLMLSPGQTIDVLVTANQPKGNYYFGISEWRVINIPGTGDSVHALGILQYSETPLSTTPTVIPSFPALFDSRIADMFNENLFGLTGYGLPQTVDREIVLAPTTANIVCNAAENCTTKFGATINNVTFDLPTTSSILQAYFYHIEGVYTTNFPPNPPGHLTPPNVPNLQYNLTDQRGTRVLTFEYNDTVQIVIQDIDVFGLDDHPFHLHGHNFYIVGRGFGNYNASTDPQNFNLVNPPLRNTVGGPVGGWVAIRFVTNNPGAWMFHCHLDRHMAWGMETVFITKDGEGPNATLPPPKHILPPCH